MIKEEFIKSLAEQQLEGTDKFIVSVKVKPGNKIMVFIDADSTVIIDDCVKLSRFIESQLDREKDDFELDVSSAGLDLPLQLQRQYLKNKGRDVKVVMNDGTVKKGQLAEVTDTGFEIIETVIEKKNKKKEVVKNHVSIAFNEVKETRLVINI